MHGSISETEMEEFMAPFVFLSLDALIFPVLVLRMRHRRVEWRWGGRTCDGCLSLFARHGDDSLRMDGTRQTLAVFRCLVIRRIIDHAIPDADRDQGGDEVRAACPLRAGMAVSRPVGPMRPRYQSARLQALAALNLSLVHHPTHPTYPAHPTQPGPAAALVLAAWTTMDTPTWLFQPAFLRYPQG